VRPIGLGQGCVKRPSPRLPWRLGMTRRVASGWIIGIWSHTNVEALMRVGISPYSGYMAKVE
jgi:hypothetical protein